jgi:hypothetical protein
MIIALDLLPVQLASIDRALLQDRLSALLRAHRRGCNAVVSTRASAVWLLDQVILIERDKSTLRRILDEITQNGATLRLASQLIRIGEPGTRLEAVGHREIRVPIDYERFDEVIQTPVLVLEDIQADLGVFKAIFRNMPSAFSAFTVGYDPLHGGGENTITVATAKAAENRIVCAVVDADCKSPHAMDRRQQRIRQITSKTGWPLYFCSITPCAEIENIFGLDVLAHLNPVRLSRTFESLIRIHSEETRLNGDICDSFCLFFDMKEGLSDRVFQRITDAESRQWLIQKLQMARIGAGAINLPGFGSHVVRQVLESNICMAEFRRVVRSSNWQSIFGRFVEDIMWTLAAPPPQRT